MYIYTNVMQKTPKIAILATGDELINGDIINTNGQFIAQTLFDHHMQPGLQLTASDDLDDITQSITYLLEHHQGLITIGGLGPTSDDLTCSALSNAIDQPLVFDELSWQHIQTRLKSLNVTIPESNKKQCYFPKGARILENTRGTANACYINHHGKPIFMLPGPPHECRPLLAQHVLPIFHKHGFIQDFETAHWLLIGLSEAHIAEQLDGIARDYPVHVGYRAAMPYIEVKLYSKDRKAFNHVKQQFLNIITPHMVSDNRKTASELFYDHLTKRSTPITIIDNATKGTLASKLLTPDTYKKVIFPDHPMQHTQITFIVDGLHRYWEQQTCQFYEIDIVMLRPRNPAKCKRIKVPNRDNSSLHYTVEFLCWTLYQMTV